MVSERAFFGVSAPLLVTSAAVTIVWCASMSAAGEMPEPGLEASAIPAAGTAAQEPRAS
jgi:hypothetical protein